jgi:hypothetical protein
MNIRVIRLSVRGRAAEAWRLSARTFPPRGRRIADAIAAWLGRWRAGRPRIRVERISSAWLRAHEMESAKRRDDR